MSCPDIRRAMGSPSCSRMASARASKVRQQYSSAGSSVRNLRIRRVDVTLTDSLPDIDLQCLGFAEFSFLMRRDPDLGERSLFREDELGEEHLCGAWRSGWNGGDGRYKIGVGIKV